MTIDAIAMGLTELEKQRLANIERNKQLLRDLELNSFQDEFKDIKPLKRSNLDQGQGQRKISRASARRTKVKLESPPAPIRKSKRLLGIKVEQQYDQALDEKSAAEIAAEQYSKQRERKGGEKDLKDSIQKGDWESALDMLSHMDKKVSQGDFFDPEANGSTKKTARAKLSSLSLADTFDPAMLRITPERITSIGFHPSSPTPLIFAGDKTGHFGIWDAEKLVEDDGEILPSVFTFQIHSRGISNFRLAPDSSQKVYTASSDGSIRCLDLASRKSTETLVTNSDPRYPEGVSDLKFVDSNVLYFSTLEGRFGMHDIRQGPTYNTMWRLHEKKIGGFSINPASLHQCATASLDRTMKLWDLRMPRPLEDSDENSLLSYGVYSSRLSISNADWNLGGQIVANGYDDTINIFDATVPKQEDMENASEPYELSPLFRIKHNCQTGRWVSILKARWHENPADGIHKFVIANMNRYIDIYSSKGEQLAHLGHDLMTAVPAVVQFHPTKNWIIGGSGTGKVYLWR